MADFITDPPTPATRMASPVPAAAGQAGWERSVLEKLALSLVEERRRARRWTIFFRLLLLAWVAAVTWWAFNARLADSDPATSGKHTALVEINGAIMAGQENSAETVNRALRAAFKDTNTAGVALRINSPGGSPVQSGLIYSEMRRLKKAHPDIPLIAVVEEMCASGGYYIASAADEIHVDKASLVGSIGVLMNGFGFVDAMHRLGVERRLFSAGDNKGFLDPFSPVVDRQREHIQGLLAQIHQQFITAVRDGRGDRLKEQADLFSGLIWTGEQSVSLGLADGLNSLQDIARDRFKAEKLVDFTDRRPLVERLVRRFGAATGAAFGDGIQSAFSGLDWR